MHMGEPTIEQPIQVLLQFAEKDVLVRTIWSLSAEQKRSHLFKQIGEQRYLSALRAGAIDNAEMTKLAFSMDPFFLKSRVVNDAAWTGRQLQIELGHLDVVEQIDKVMGLVDEAPADTPPSA